MNMIEKVNPSHPDKVADRIAGAIVDLAYKLEDNPKIAVAVYVENGGWGATYGVPIGALIMEKYLKGELSPQSEMKANDIQKRRIDYGIHER